MFRFGDFIKKEEEIIIARNIFHSVKLEENKLSSSEELAVIYLNSKFAKKNGYQEGMTLKITHSGRSVNLKVKISEDAGKPTIPNCIYSNYLVNFQTFKKFTGTVEVIDGVPTDTSKIIDLLKSYIL